jgi:hypothetical protein
MSQRTPFTTPDEAFKEYMSIYKSKTGNILGEPFE